MKTTVTVACDTEFYHNYIDDPMDPDLVKDKVPYPLWKNPGPWFKGKTTKSLPKGMCPADIDPPLAEKQINFIGCPSTRNLFNKTIVIPFPGDVRVKYDPVQQISGIDTSVCWMQVTGHERWQFGDAFPGTQNAKFVMPYRFRVNNLPMYFSPPHLHPEYLKIPFLAMHGMVHVKKEMWCIINTLMQEEPFTDFVTAGTVLAYVTFPSIKGKVDVKFTDRSKDKGEWMSHLFHGWNRSYKY